MKNDSKGILALLIAASLYSLIGVISRFIGDELPVFFQQIVRYILSLLILTPFLLHFQSWKSIEKKDWRWFLLRGICGLISFLGIYTAFLYTSFSNVYFVSYATSTIGGYLFGKILFQEKHTRLQIFLLFIALLGLYFVYPAKIESTERLFVLVLSIAGLATSAWMAISRKITENYSTLQTMVVDYCIGLFVLTILSFTFSEKWTLPSFDREWIYLFLLLLSQLSTNFLIIYGFQRVEMHFGSLILLFDIVLGISLGAILFKEYLSATSVFGGSLVIISMAVPHLLGILKKGKEMINVDL